VKTTKLKKRQGAALRTNTQAAARMRRYRDRQRAARWPSGPYWWKRLTPAQRRELAAIDRAIAKQLDNKHEH
jgi:hypothetical protein